MSFIEAPCKNCERKGCGAYHSKCESYLRYVEEHNKEKRVIQDIKYKERQLDDLKSCLMEKYSRNHRRH